MHDPSKRSLKIAGASLVLLALVWQHVQATRLGYQVEESRREIRILQSEIGALDVNIEKSLAPAQLAAQAQRHLGMFPASPQALRILDSPDGGARADGFLTRLLTRAGILRGFART